MNDFDDDVVQLLNQYSPFKAHNGNNNSSLSKNKSRSAAAAGRPFSSKYRSSGIEDFKLRPEELYLDENGLPTDKFLDSLKDDYLLNNDVDDIASSLRASKHYSAINSQYKAKKIPSSKDRRDLLQHSSSRIHANPINVHDRPFLDDNMKQEAASRLSKHDVDDSSSASDDIDYTHESDDSTTFSHRSSDRRKSDNSHPHESYRYKESNVISKPLYHDTNKKQSNHRSSSSDLNSSTFTRQKSSKDIENMDSSSSQPSRPVHFETISTGIASTQTDSVHQQDTGSPYTPEKQIEQRTELADLSIVDIDSEMKYKSLNLRIKGQIQTIKTLESQVQESLAVIDIRNKQLKQAQNRVAVLEKKLSLSQSMTRSSESNGYQPSSHIRNAEQLASKYKAQNESLSSKLLEEQAKKQRLEERCKAVRDYCDKIKERNSELETLSKSQEQQVQELQAKLNKSKKECRNYAAEVGVQKKVLKEKDDEVLKVKSKGDKSSSVAKHMQRTIDKLNQDMELTKLEMNTVKDRNKHYQIEVQILKEQLLLRQNIVDLTLDIDHMNQQHHSFEDSVRPQSKKIEQKKSEPSSSSSNNKKSSHHSVNNDVNIDDDRWNRERSDQMVKDAKDDLSFESFVKNRADRVINRPHPRPKSADTMSLHKSSDTNMDRSSAAMSVDSNNDHRRQRSSYDNNTSDHQHQHNSSTDHHRSNQRSIFEEFEKANKAKVRSRSISPGHRPSFNDSDSSILSMKHLHNNNHNHEVEQKYKAAEYLKPPLPSKEVSLNSSILSSTSSSHHPIGSYDRSSHSALAVNNTVSSSIDSLSKASVSSTGSSVAKDKYNKLKSMFDRLHHKS